MAKLQAVIAMTLDGSIPTESEPLMEWIQSDRDGFPYWRKRGTRLLFPGYPLVSLICEKDTAGPSTVFHAEIYDVKSVEFLRGLSLYSLVDELVIFLIPLGQYLPFVRLRSPPVRQLAARQIQDLPERRVPPALLQDVAIDRCRTLQMQYARQPSSWKADFLFL